MLHRASGTLPYGATRSGGVPTDYQFTGQRLDAGTGLYYYGARYYDPVTGRFISADTIVPSAGSPQALNRYSYVYNNPMRYADPNGHEGCSADDDACWRDEWSWKNRWYNAHGYSWGTSHWSVRGDPVFADEGITDDVIGEAGISLSSGIRPWSWDDKKKVAYGVAMFGQGLSQGIAGFARLLGGVTTMFLGWSPPECMGGAANCAPPPLFADGHTVFLLAGFTSQVAVHELAHVIDWNNTVGGQSFSAAWSYAPLSVYAQNSPWVFGQWETWAEAVTAFVFRDYEKDGRQKLDTRIYQEAFDLQMLAVQALLEGWH